MGVPYVRELDPALFLVIYEKNAVFKQNLP